MTTIGMNYEVREGKQNAFEKKFALVVELMRSLPGHRQTHLYRDAYNECSYLMVSEWCSRADFDAFVGSGAFRKVAAWGEANILASRPRHVVYGEEPGSVSPPPHVAQTEVRAVAG